MQINEVMPKSKNENLLPSWTPACGAILISTASRAGTGWTSECRVLWSSPEVAGPASGPMRVPCQPVVTRQLRALPFPAVPLWLFYKMHFLQKHRKVGTDLPLWPAAFNLQLSYCSASLEGIQIPSKVHEVSPHLFCTSQPDPSIKILKWFKLEHQLCLVTKSTPFLLYLMPVLLAVGPPSCRSRIPFPGFPTNKY